MKKANLIFQRHFQRIINQAKSTLLDFGNHARILIVGNGQQQYVIELPTNAATPEARLNVMYQTGMELAQHHAFDTIHEIFLIAEASVSVVPTRTFGTVGPTKPPVRKSALIVV